tara:strand:- start:2278 stop:2616 length:339 start_codon:yes stop_codon:yes gene_type:complete
MDLVFELILIGGIVGFSIWLSALSWRLANALEGVGQSEDQLDEIRESIEIVATILNKLPELMPQFNMNTNPLQPIFEAFAQKLSGAQPLMTYEPERGPDGQYHGTTKESEND